MARTKTSIFLDEDFKAFLEYLREETDIPISRLLERATREKYNVEYERYSKEKRKGDLDA